MRIKEYILQNTILKRRLKLLEEKKKLYETIKEPEDIYNYQINKFNEIWKSASTNVPFYKMWKEQHKLPDSIKRLDELKSFPILTKKDIQQNYDLIFGYLKSYKTISTGGSTGEPTRFPISDYFFDYTYINSYIARSWHRINPLEQIVLFWGHSHLFGSGIKGKVNHYKRQLKDSISNQVRYSAYALDFDSFEAIYNDMNKNKISTALGYTSFLYKFSKYLSSKNKTINHITKIILTSENISEDDIQTIQSAFPNAKIIKEYGMSETGVIAYTDKEASHYHVLWDSNILFEINNEMTVTRLYNDLFPLINYTTGDYLIGSVIGSQSILDFENIEGRRNDSIAIMMNNGEIIETHSELLTHILKSIDNVIDFRVVQHKDYSIEINTKVFSEEVNMQSKIIEKIKMEYPEINEKKIKVQNDHNFSLTTAGKTKWVTRL